MTEIPELVDVAEKHDATRAQVSLAWLPSKENVVVVPRSTTPAHVRQNLVARTLDLDDEDVRRIDAFGRTRRVVDLDGAPWN